MGWFFSILLFTVVSGVTATSTFRLKKTWALLDRNTATMISELQTLLSRDNNFKNYRAALRLVQPPLLPYLGVYLTDLTFIDQGNSDLLPGTQVRTSCCSFTPMLTLHSSSTSTNDG